MLLTEQWKSLISLLLQISGKGNVFVKNLDKGLEVKSLYQSFGFMGKILSFKLATDDKGRSKGFGFIHYEDEATVDKVIERANGKIFQGKAIYVGRFVPRRERISDSTPMKFNNLFVKNFDETVTDEKLLEMFTPMGPILSAKVMLNDDGSSKRFGFVCFQNFDDAEKAVLKLNDKQLSPEVKLYVGRAMKKTERVNMLKAYYEKKRQERADKFQGCNLYIKNLVESITDERLLEEFSKFGNITSAKVMRDEKGTSKGFGFVCFESPESASSAIKTMENVDLDGKKIYIAVAQLKEIRQANLMARYARVGSMNVNQFYSQPGYMYPMRPPRYHINQFSAGAPDLRIPPYSMQQMMAGQRRPGNMGHFDRFTSSHSQIYRPPRQFHTSRPSNAFTPNFQGNMSRRVPGMNNGQSGAYPRGGMQFKPQHQMYRDNQYPHPGYQEDLPMSQKQISTSRTALSSLTSTSSASQIMHGNRQLEAQTALASQFVNADKVQSEEKPKGSIGVNELANMTIQERKKILGGAINNLAYTMYGPEAAKITGVLLESDMDLISKIQDETALKSEIIAVHNALNSNKPVSVAASSK